jgi:hypothetical protein
MARNTQSGVVVAGGVFGGVVFLAGLDVAIAALVRDPVKFLQSLSGVMP